MATIRDIAKSSGVSVTTVSRVLNSPLSVNAETRERVLATMRQFNYRPSPIFYGENSNASRAIGIYGLAHSLTRHPYFTSLLEGILSVTSDLNWSVTLLTQKEWNEPHRNLRAYTDGRCEGLLLAGLPNDHPIIPAVQERGLPFILISGPIGSTEINSVDIDDRKASFEVTSYLITLGHRRIAMFPGQEIFQSVALRVLGYQDALNAAGLSESCRVVPGTFHEYSGYERTLAMLALPASQRPTALVCSTDGIAKGALQALKEHGKGAPQEMSVIGFDDVPLAAYFEPPLTTVRQSTVEIGRYAAKRLLELIHDPMAIPTQKLFDIELIVRSSTAPPSHLTS